jgi:hypothetical protein
MGQSDRCEDRALVAVTPVPCIGCQPVALSDMAASSGRSGSGGPARGVNFGRVAFAAAVGDSPALSWVCGQHPASTIVPVSGPSMIRTREALVAEADQSSDWWQGTAATSAGSLTCTTARS